MKIEKSHMPKSKPCFEILEQNFFYGTLKPGKIKLEVFLNSKSKKNVKSEKWFCTLPPQLIMPPAPLPPGKTFSFLCMVQIFFWNLTHFFYFEFKNTSNLIFPDFKVPSESFLFKNFETGLTFCHMWFFNFQNLVRTCKHIGETPCIIYYQ